jgi:hypothetical protein
VWLARRYAAPRPVAINFFTVGRRVISSLHGTGGYAEGLITIPPGPSTQDAHLAMEQRATTCKTLLVTAASSD